MFMPSIWATMAGFVLTAILLAANWYIWGPGCRTLRSDGPDSSHRPAVDRENNIRLPRTTAVRAGMPPPGFRVSLTAAVAAKARSSN
jgi:hypothetical protein